MHSKISKAVISRTELNLMKAMLVQEESVESVAMGLERKIIVLGLL